MLFLPLALLFLVGAAVGVLSTFFGVGGGILIVPGLYMLFPDILPTTVISCSLGTIFINSIVNTYNFWKIDCRPSPLMVLLLAPSMAVGAFLGGNIAPMLPAVTIKNFFGGVLVLLGFRFLFSRSMAKTSSHRTLSLKTTKKILIALTAFFGGILSGVTGLGGGVFLVPVLIFIAGVPLNRSPVELNVVMGISSFCGLVGYVFFNTLSENPFSQHPLGDYQVGHLNLGISLIISLGAVTTSRWGAALAQKVEPITAKRWFTLLLFFFAAHILWQNNS